MDDVKLTAVATAFLVLVGIAQVVVLLAQRHQQRLDWAEMYRRRWIELKGDWATVVFLGRRASDYYQVAHHDSLQQLRETTMNHSHEIASSWAQASVRNVCGMLSDLCSRILRGDLRISDVYPIFGTELLRQGAPLRTLLDGNASHLKCYGSIGPTEEEKQHDNLHSEMTTWLVCHDGIRRRCLIMIDLLWAEAVRLEDLPPIDVEHAANSKLRTGHLNRSRLRDEAYRLGTWWRCWHVWTLTRFLLHSEWRRFPRLRGLSRSRLKKLNDYWTKRYLNL